MTNDERQSVIDEEHLKLLRIGYIVSGILTLVLSVVPLIYVVIGVVFAAAGSRIPTHRNDPDPAVLGVVFIVVGLLASAIMACIGALKLYTARSIGRREKRVLSMVIAGIECLSIPYGTLLGAFTFVVLGRPSVQSLYESPRASLGPPPPPQYAPLFSESDVRR